jgi:hypothetical protein
MEAVTDRSWIFYQLVGPVCMPWWITRMALQDSFVAELEDAIKCRSQEKRVETLRRITDLFLSDANRFNEAQIGVLDDVPCHLIERIETRAMVGVT